MTRQNNHKQTPPMATRKTILYLNRKAPHGSSHAYEALETVLIGAAFDQNVWLAFVDDGVYQLASRQHAGAIGMKNHAAAYLALGDYDVSAVFVERESLAARGLTLDDLLPVQHEDSVGNTVSSLEIVSAAELARRMEQADVILSF